MQKNLTEVLADLRLDLKDSGALWSDAELTRCVKRAVGDLSRFLPLEQTHEITFDLDVSDESWTSPATADEDKFVDAADISATVAGGTMTLTGTQPDIPRPVKITVTDADTSITAFCIIVKGNDIADKYIEESFYLSGGLIQTGKRYFKRVLEVEVDAITGNGAADVLDVGTDTHVGVWTELANKPIEAGSVENVTTSGGGTSYVLDTDFEIDYQQGRIALKSGGSMSAATAYEIDYKKSAIHIDISSLKDLIRIDRVEYPTGQVPQEYASLEVFNKILILKGSARESQSKVSDEYHAVLYYMAEHFPPAASAPGSYPGFLSFTVELAAAAYALFMKAAQYEHQAATDFAAARTILTGTINTATTGTHALAKVALDKAAVLLVASTGKIDLALTKVATYLETNTNYAAKLLLEDITTALHTAVATAAGHGDAVLTQLSEALSISESDINAVYTEQQKFLLTSGGYTGAIAQTLLAAGDDFINAVPLGSRVPENYREYAEAAAKLADIAGQVGNNLASLAYAESNRLSAIAQSMSAAAQSLQAAVNSASVLVENNRSYREEAQAWIAIAEAFVAEASQWIAAVNAAVSEAMGRVAEIDRYLTEAQQYAQIAEGNMRLAEVFRIEAAERRNEAWTIWRSPPEYSPMYTLSAGRQVTSGS